MTFEEFNAAKVEAEVAKLKAETEKLKSESAAAIAPWWDVWRRPGAIGSMLTGLAAVGTAAYAIGNGFLDAKKAELEARVVLLQAKETSLKATNDVEQKLITVRKENLEVENQLLEKDETSLKSERAEFIKNQNEFATQKSKIERENADLIKNNAGLSKENEKLQRSAMELEAKVSGLDLDRRKLSKTVDELNKRADNLQEQIRRSALQVPLDNVLNDEKASALQFNNNYTAILAALKQDDKSPEEKVGDIAFVEAGIEKAQTASVKANLYRALYLATGDARYLSALTAIATSEWPSVDMFFWDILSSSVDWPLTARISLFGTLTEILGKMVAKNKHDPALDVARVMSDLCRWSCADKLNSEIAQQAMVMARNALIGADPSVKYRRNYALSLINMTNPFAARLLLADIWRREPNSEWGAYAKSYLQIPNGLQAGNEPLPKPDQPVSESRQAWLDWLARHSNELEAVLHQPVTQWPDGKT